MCHPPAPLSSAGLGVCESFSLIYCTYCRARTYPVFPPIEVLRMGVCSGHPTPPFLGLRFQHEMCTYLETAVGLFRGLWLRLAQVWLFDSSRSGGKHREKTPALRRARCHSCRAGSGSAAGPCSSSLLGAAESNGLPPTPALSPQALALHSKVKCDKSFYFSRYQQNSLLKLQF